MQEGEWGSFKHFIAFVLLQPSFRQKKDKVIELARMMSPKPDYLRANRNLSNDLLSNCLMSTYYVLGTMVGDDFKGFFVIWPHIIWSLLVYIHKTVMCSLSMSTIAWISDMIRIDHLWLYGFWDIIMGHSRNLQSSSQSMGNDHLCLHLPWVIQMLSGSRWYYPMNF